MCYCNPNVRAARCGGPECHPLAALLETAKAQPGRAGLMERHKIKIAVAVDNLKTAIDEAKEAGLDCSFELLENVKLHAERKDYLFTTPHVFLNAKFPKL